MKAVRQKIAFQLQPGEVYRDISARDIIFRMQKEANGQDFKALEAQDHFTTWLLAVVRG